MKESLRSVRSLHRAISPAAKAAGATPPLHDTSRPSQRRRAEGPQGCAANRCGFGHSYASTPPRVPRDRARHAVKPEAPSFGEQRRPLLNRDAKSSPDAPHPEDPRSPAAARPADPLTTSSPPPPPHHLLRLLPLLCPPLIFLAAADFALRPGAGRTREGKTQTALFSGAQGSSRAARHPRTAGPAAQPAPPRASPGTAGLAASSPGAAARGRPPPLLLLSTKGTRDHLYPRGRRAGSLTLSSRVPLPGVFWLTFAARGVSAARRRRGRSAHSSEGGADRRAPSEAASKISDRLRSASGRGSSRGPRAAPLPSLNSLFF